MRLAAKSAAKCSARWPADGSGSDTELLVFVTCSTLQQQYAYDGSYTFCNNSEGSRLQAKNKVSASFSLWMLVKQMHCRDGVSSASPQDVMNGILTVAGKD